MKIQPECVPCLLKRIIFEAELSSNDLAVKTKVLRNACMLLSELYDPQKCSADIATKVHKLVYDTLQDTDPYDALKKESNTVALSLLPKVEALIHNADDPLKTGMICSIIGNMMDFGIDGASSDPSMLSKIFLKMYQKGLGYDDYPQVKEILQNAKKVLLFTDNCGEIVFDKLLCRELKILNPSLFVTLVVRGEPIISDATLKDAKTLNFREVVDEILTTGCFAIGVNFQRLPLKVGKRIKDSDLIICKGMANYESFSETDYHPIVYLLRTKCHAIATSMKLPQNINAIKLFK